MLSSPRLDAGGTPSEWSLLTQSEFHPHGPWYRGESTSKARPRGPRQRCRATPGPFSSLSAPPCWGPGTEERVVSTQATRQAPRRPPTHQPGPGCSVARKEETAGFHAPG